MMVRFLVVFCFYFFSTFLVIGQRNKTAEQLEPHEMEEYAELYLQEGQFEKAVLMYRKLHSTNEKSPRLNFLLGYCYLNTEFGLEKAITHLKQSIELIAKSFSEEAPLEAYYYLAMAYYQNNQYKQAIVNIDKLLTKIPERNQLFTSRANLIKTHSKNAALLTHNSIKIDEENIFDLNSKYSDKNPLVLNKGKEIIFTSRRAYHRTRKNIKESQFDDNIFHAKLEDGTWRISFAISKNLNTLDDESACWVSNDGKYLIIRRTEKNRSNLYFSTRKGDSDWGIPVKFPEPINSRNNETFGSLSVEGKYLYFTSDRRGGLGGTDIYVSENKGNNTWGMPKSLGALVNTELNEESPIMHENGVLFFCSEGHISMGGFDVFTSSMDKKGVWQKAANLGSPINSIKDDFFYQPVAHGQYAYSSSERLGSKGQSDIFKYQLIDSTGRGFALVVGKIKCQQKIDWDKSVTIKVRELSGKYNIKKYKTNQFGDFTISLQAAKTYQISYLYNNQVFYQAKLNFPKSYSYLANDQSVRLKDVELELDASTKRIKQTVAREEDYYNSENRATNKIKSGAALIAAEKAKEDSIILAESGRTVTSNDSSEITQSAAYSIKLATSKYKKPLSSFNQLEADVREYQDQYGNFIYYLGEYQYEWEAEIKLRLIREDFPNAKVFINDFALKTTN